MDYEPWPENGCSLAEARHRTVESVLSDQPVQVSGSRLTKVKAIEKALGATCRDHLRNGRLVAYGRRGSSNAEPQLISSSQWSALTRIDWQRSTTADDRAQIEFFDIPLYPPLLAPFHPYL